ncbi:MAG: ABC transporter substrate-binding protein [Euryarchaeota archaeon]|nr:ABC transporter substrate-binding protein [Euryarchaeota archaeon]
MRARTISLGIAITILLLVLALPAATSDYTLEVFGNANEDETINMQDVTYTELIILEYRDKTDLADAKHDGKINMQDVTQIELVILGKEKEITLIDETERVVTVDKPIERLVAGYRHPIETLRSLKVPKEMIVGVEETWLDPVFFPEFADTPTVGIVWNPDVEAILSLNPDLVILYGSTSPSREGALATATDVLELAGVTVIRVSLTRPETYPELVVKIGYVFDREEEADEFNEFIRRCLSSVSETTTIPEEDMPKVYFESSFGPYNVIMESCQPYIGMAGGKDVFAGLSGNIDPEAVVEQNPAIIVKKAPREYRDRIGYGVDADDTEAMEEIRDEILNRLELQNVDAIKTGQVYVICGYLTPGGPVSGTRSFLLPAYLAKMFHPDRFEDVDPTMLHQEYITEFQGLEIDPDEKGVFVYPRLEGCES